jgi:thiamine-phosphate pyrophosphorylase
VSFELRTPAACLITTGESTAENFADTKKEILETIRLAAEAGISLIQIREKQLPARLVWELARDAAAMTSRTGAKLLVNDRADIAVAAGADGVHLPSNSIPVEIVRRYFPVDLIIGVSAHSLDEVLAARAEGADFAAFAPVFSTPGKGVPQGLNELERVRDAVGEFPILALGGIDETNFESVLTAGAAGFAAIRALNDCDKRSVIMDRLGDLSHVG